MALLGNYNIFNKNPMQNTGGDSLSGIVGLRYNWNQSGISNNRFYGENWIITVADRCGVPNGYSAPYSWKLPMKTGGIGSNVGVQGSGAFAGSGALGMNIDSTIAGSGTIDNANLGLILSAVATLSGIGGLSADVLGALQASATLAGQGDMNGSLGALAGAVATLSGTSTLTGDINALASISADIYVNQSEASVQQIVDGVWNALATNYNTSGTMGEATQTGGAGGGATPAQIWSYGTRTLTDSAGLTTEEHAHLMKLRNGGGGALINYESIEKGLSKDREWLYKKIEEIPGIVKESEEKVIESIGIVNNGISYIIESNEIETLSDKIDKLEVKTDESIKLSKEQAQEGKKKVEKLSHTIETYRLEDEIKEETKELEQLHEVKIETEVKELETEIQIQDEVKTLALEAKIQEEIKLLSNI